MSDKPLMRWQNGTVGIVIAKLIDSKRAFYAYTTGDPPEVCPDVATAKRKAIGMLRCLADKIEADI